MQYLKVRTVCQDSLRCDWLFVCQDALRCDWLFVYQDSLLFITLLKQAIPTISQLLGSKSSTDVLEAINFFVAGHEFGVGDTTIGIRRMMLLVWSKEQTVKEAVVSAYRQLYLSPDANSSRYSSRCLPPALPLGLTPTITGTCGRSESKI